MISNNGLDGDMFGVSQFQQVNNDDDNDEIVMEKIIDV